MADLHLDPEIVALGREAARAAWIRCEGRVGEAMAELESRYAHETAGCSSASGAIALSVGVLAGATIRCVTTVGLRWTRRASAMAEVVWDVHDATMASIGGACWIGSVGFDGSSAALGVAEFSTESEAEQWARDRARQFAGRECRRARR